MDKIILKGVRFYGYHGVFDFEKQAGQDFLVDLNLYKNLKEICNNDDIQNAISYADVYEDVKQFFTKSHKRDLIEKVADDIAKYIIKKYEVEKIAVTVKKPDAPVDGDFGYFGVSIERNRCDYNEA